MNKSFKNLGFKSGDTVVCTATDNQRICKVVDTHTLEENCYGISKSSKNSYNGLFGEWKLKEKNMRKFKIGDKVKVIKRSGFFGYHDLEMGGIYEISETYGLNGYHLKAVGSSKSTSASFVHKGEIELYSEDMFEDQWHLNDGKVEIPDDADKLEKNGSVVAFRKRKVKPFEFGEKLRIKKSLWPIDIKANPGFDYVDAVYLSKYYDPDNREGIKVYVDNGEKGWECCLLDLGKVERLT